MRRGQSLVEFAIVLPVLMVLLLVTIDFGRVMFTYIQVTNAAREGANVGMWNPNDLPDIQQRAMDEVGVQGQYGEGGLNVVVDCIDSNTGNPVSCSAAPPSGLGAQVRVTVTRSFSFFTPLVGNLFPGFSLSASATAFTLSPIGSQLPVSTGTPGSSASASASASGSGSTSSSSPSASASTQLCKVPDFLNPRTRGRDAQSKWTAAGFTADSPLKRTAVGDNQWVKQQSLGANTWYACSGTAITLT